MRQRVKYFDYPLQFNAHKKDYLKVIEDVLSRGSYILGNDLAVFERNLAKFCKCKFSVGVGNGTDALLLALYAAGIGPQDEVISVAHTFVATIEVIKILGAKPIFVDIADDHNMNVDLVGRAITSKTKAIIPVHLNGRICSGMDRLSRIAKKYNLLIIEDAAQSLGATYKGKSAGTFGLAGCFSFYPAKLLGAFGDAGAIITNDEQFAEKLILLRNHGRGGGVDVKFWGLNCRMDNVQAAILNYKLRYLKSWIRRRRSIASLYSQCLLGLKDIKLPALPKEGDAHYDIFQNFEIEVENRDKLVRYLKNNGIDVNLPWGGKAVHQFRALGISGVYLPRTEALFKKVVMLPLYPELRDAQIEYIACTIRNFYCENGRKT